MARKKRILLKLTGELFRDRENKQLTAQAINNIIKQIKELNNSYQFGIVIGGGNFFRGREHGKLLGISASMAHQVGMLATMMNGLIIKDLFEQNGVPSSLFCAVPSPEVVAPISQQAIKSALTKNHCIIFSGGTGNPFFSTDTTAVLRCLQIQANEVWKGTLVDGIYDQDPRKNPDAKFVKTIYHTQMLNQQLGIMDAAAIALANQHQLLIRVFNIFQKNALLLAAHDESFGSRVQSQRIKRNST